MSIWQILLVFACNMKRTIICEKRKVFSESKYCLKMVLMRSPSFKISWVTVGRCCRREKRKELSLCPFHRGVSRRSKRVVTATVGMLRRHTLVHCKPRSYNRQILSYDFKNMVVLTNVQSMFWGKNLLKIFLLTVGIFVPRLVAV